MNLHRLHALLGLTGVVLVACFHGPTPTATLSPRSADSLGRSKRPYPLELETDGPAVAALHFLGPAGVTMNALPSDAGFRVQFDQAVEPSAVLANATLRVFAGDGDRGEMIKMTASRATSITPGAK